MEDQLGWPFLIGLLLATLAAGTALEQVGVRRRLVAAMPPAERWFLRLALGLALVTWWGVVLVQLGWFDARTLVLAPAVIFLLRLPARLVVDGPMRPRRRWQDGRWVVAALVVLIGAALYFPPYDVRLEARDPGVYYHAGVQASRTGGIEWVDPLLAEMNQQEKAYWLPPPSRRAINESYRFVGFYVEHRADARVAPQALPVFPVWVAAGYMALGPAGGLGATPILAILGALATFFFVGRWFGPVAGTAAAVALATGMTQVWFARYSAAEFAAQFFVCAGLYGLVCYRRHGDAAFGWLAAAGFGLSFMTKAELMILIAPLTLILVYDTARRGLAGRDWARFWVPLALLTAHTLVHARLLLWPYYFDLLQQLHLTPAQFAAIAGGGAGGLGALLLLLHHYQRQRASRPQATRDSAAGGTGSFVTVGTAGAWLAAAAILLFFAWGLWLRPGRGWDSANFLQLTWAISPWLLGLGVAGAVGLLLAPRGTRGRDAIFGLLLALIVLGLYRRQIIPLLPWAYRRWIPAVLPGFLALAGGASAWLMTGRPAGRRPRAPLAPWLRRIGPVVAVAMLVPALAYQVANTRFYRDHLEMPGVGAILADLEASLTPGALVIFEPRTLRGMERFEAALAIGGGFDVLRLPRPQIDEAMLRNVVLRAARRGQDSYLITTGYIDGLQGMRAEPLRPLRFPTQRLYERNIRGTTFEDFGRGLPRRVEGLTFNGRVYRLLPESSPLSLQGRLDVGDWDDPYLLGSHFNEIEYEGDGTPARWTRGDAGFWLPGLHDGASQLIVRAASNNPPELGESSMTVLLDGEVLGTALLVDGWFDYEFAIPEAWGPPADGAPYVTIEVPGFRPADVIPGSTDTRRIGIKVDKVGWLPVAPAAER